MSGGKHNFSSLFIRFLPLLVVILLAAIMRFLWLDRVPVGVVHDELTYLLNAKAIAHTGTDVSASWNPLSVFIFRYPPGDVQAELPYLLFVPVLGLFPFSLLSAHITNAVIGIATVIILYFLAEDFFGKEVAFLTGLIAAINPWSVYINRTAYEVTPAIFFYLLGFLILLKTKNKQIFWAFPIFLLGFYSYIGMKLIFTFVIISALVFLWFRNNKKNTREYVLFGLLSILVTVAYLVLLKSQPGSSRLGELFSFSDPSIVHTVNQLRNAQIVSPVGSVFDNKIVIGSIVLITKFLKTFSFDYLFVYGDAFFSLWHHGLFYYIDVVFLFAGFVNVFVLSKRVFYFLIAMICIGTLPQLAHSADVVNFTPHIAFVFPWLIVFIGVGLWSVIKGVKQNLAKSLLTLLIVLLYAFSIGNFLNVYFFQNPIEGGYFGLSDRLVSQYVKLASTNGKVHVYAHQPVDFAERYLFYSNAKGVSPEQMRQVLSRGELSLGNVMLSSCKDIDPSKVSGTAIVDFICEKSNPPHHLTVPQLSDGGEVYGIYNDTLCGKYPLNPYPSHLTIQDLAAEKLSVSSFCEAFITSH